MAFASDLVRTKNWGNEVLTDADLEGQLDLIINWLMASLNSSTGHDHSGTSNKGPKVLVSSLTLSSGAAGDVVYHNGTNLVRLAKGTAYQSLRMNSGATAPEWGAPVIIIASQAQGDVIYFNGTDWTRLAAGTAGQYLKTGGASANPAWGGFGDWASKSNNTAYLAATDGFVLAYSTISYGTVMEGYTDGSNPPTTLRAQCGTGENVNNHQVSIMFPVKAGDYYKVNTGTVFFLPAA